MGRKGVIFGGFGRQKRGQKGVFGAPEAGKRRFSACGRGDWRAQRGFRDRIGHYVSASARPKSTPGTMRRVRQMRGEVRGTGHWTCASLSCAFPVSSRVSCIRLTLAVCQVGPGLRKDGNLDPVESVTIPINRTRVAVARTWHSRGDVRFTVSQNLVKAIPTKLCSL